MLLQAVSGAPAPSWPRAAIHDSVASVVRQLAYRRDLQNTLLDRLLQWINETLARMFGSLRGMPHGRQAAVVAAAVLVVLVAARIIYAARLRAAALTHQHPTGGEGGATFDPWRDAERLAQEGRYTDAAHALYRAAVTALAARGLVRPHESKTSGDYARELRRRNVPSYMPFRRFGSRYDRIIYGTGICDAANYEVLLADARAIVEASRGERAA
jgi:hypothetical protein